MKVIRVVVTIESATIFLYRDPSKSHSVVLYIHMYMKNCTQNISNVYNVTSNEYTGPLNNQGHFIFIMKKNGK